jgi:Zn-dependent protease with chaperone function
MRFEVNPKEKLYFILMLVISLLIYVGLVFSIIGIFYLFLFGMMGFVSHGLYVGHIRGNGIRVSNKQFPEIYQTAEQLSKQLGLERTPSIYILEAGGLLNAFATRFLGRDFVIIYSDVLELAYEEGEAAVRFVVAHELAHLKRKHLKWRYLLSPAMFIPFLGSAYSRACEYTCDQIAVQLAPDGAISGLLVLGVGKKMYKKINLEEIINQSKEERGFWIWLSEVSSTHPNLTKRLSKVSSDRLLVSNNKYLSSSLNI